MMIQLNAIPAKPVDWRDDGSVLRLEDVSGWRWSVLTDHEDGTLTVESPSGGITATYEFPIYGDQGVILWAE